MDKKKIITIVSISVTALVVVVTAILLINKNNETTKVVATGQNMSDNEVEIIEDDGEEEDEEIFEEENADPTLEPSATPKLSPKPTIPKDTYYIKVNNQMNTVTIYKKDENGEYSIPVKAMVCSTGYSSPQNSKYQLKGRWTWGLMFGGVYTQYETLITGNILFHSVPYLTQYDNGSLEYWLYDKLGTTCSAGCIRLTVADAQWIYYNCPPGTWVEFYSSSNPGPLGKPSAMKISGNVECRGWDPTDPNPNNPWRNVNTNVPEEIPETEVAVPEVPTPEVVLPTPVVVPSVIPTSVTRPTQTPIETSTPMSTPRPTQQPETTPTPQPTENPTEQPAQAPAEPED